MPIPHKAMHNMFMTKVCGKFHKGKGCYEKERKSKCVR
jgi:hypothetical protein